MPLYLATIKKEFVTGTLDVKPWVNTYHIDAVDLAAALAVGGDILEIEKNVHWAIVRFTQLYARQVDFPGQEGRAQALNVFGDRAVGSNTFLPSFCAVRVTFNDDIGRPDQKYLRLPLAEDSTENGQLDTAEFALLGAGYLLPMLSVGGVVSSNGVTYTGGAIQPNIQNRQRGWHRRTRVGYKRGWVPV